MVYYPLSEADFASLESGILILPKFRAITELPFGLTGRVFRSPMPFGPFDPERIAYAEMKENRVQAVVILTEEDEYRQHTGEDLKAFYIEEGLISKYRYDTARFSTIPEHCAILFGGLGLQTEIALPFSAIISYWAIFFLRRITLATTRPDKPEIRRVERIY